MLDLAREQCPTQDILYRYARHALDSGYDALGLYTEHRLAYQSAPWATGKHALSPQTIKNIAAEFPSLQIVPFVNLLGHVEGLLYTEEGRPFREEPFAGLQGCPSEPAFVQLMHDILEETLQTFDSPLVHIGGDETAQLNRCPRCQSRTQNPETGEDPPEDPKAWLYSRHFQPLVQKVKDAGRTPAIWGDMILEHPQILPTLPEDTIVFDWQYQNGLADTAPRFAPLRVVGCPTLHIYNALWMHTEASEKNVREVAADVHTQNLHGFCLTTWEFGLFSAADTALPAIAWAAQTANDPQTPATLLQAYAEATPWATTMGQDFERLGGVFAFSGHRHKLRSRLLLNGNPFLAWFHHHPELAGESGKAALALAEQAVQQAPGEPEKNIALFARAAIEFVRIADEARQHYSAQRPDAAITKLALLRTLCDDLEKIARQNHARIGGSLADIERARAAKKHVELVITRVRDYGNRELGYLPAFEVITNHRFIPHDQACWWLVNKWSQD